MEVRESSGRACLSVCSTAATLHLNSKVGLDGRLHGEMKPEAFTHIQRLLISDHMIFSAW